MGRRVPEELHSTRSRSTRRREAQDVPSTNLQPEPAASCQWLEKATAASCHVASWSRCLTTRDGSCQVPNRLALMRVLHVSYNAPSTGGKRAPDTADGGL